MQVEKAPAIQTNVLYGWRIAVTLGAQVPGPCKHKWALALSGPTYTGPCFTEIYSTGGQVLSLSQKDKAVSKRDNEMDREKEKDRGGESKSENELVRERARARARARERERERSAKRVNHPLRSHTSECSHQSRIKDLRRQGPGSPVADPRCP